MEYISISPTKKTSSLYFWIKTFCENVSLIYNHACFDTTGFSNHISFVINVNPSRMDHASLNIEYIRVDECTIYDGL
jgi:hypothetical protein